MNNGDARAEIMRSIRAHLGMSAPYDGRETRMKTDPSKSPSKPPPASVTDAFKQNLESVDGHCIVVRNEAEVAAALTQITKGRRIVTSDAPPPAKELFGYDVGITTAQAAIAETGTLVLDSAFEKHRLVSLVPPVHVAIIDASQIYLTLAEALAALQRGPELSPAITLITGPSRTADIELTLALGVHGPQELHVIVREGTA